ncbi:MAG TPA: hypothetical protein VIP28_13275 [Nocardioides sp.]
MGQHIVGHREPWGRGCLPLVGILLVGATLTALIAWLNWPRP